MLGFAVTARDLDVEFAEPARRSASWWRERIDPGGTPHAEVADPTSPVDTSAAAIAAAALLTLAALGGPDSAERSAPGSTSSIGTCATTGSSVRSATTTPGVWRLRMNWCGAPTSWLPRLRCCPGGWTNLLGEMCRVQVSCGASSRRATACTCTSSGPSRMRADRAERYNRVSGVSSVSPSAPCTWIARSTTAA